MRLDGGEMTDSNWRVRAVEEFNADGRSDLLWQHSTTGELTAWLMFQTGRLHVVAISPGGVADTNWEWSVPATSIVTGMQTWSGRIARMA